MEIRVYYEDTDCGNVVYYANYLRYFERARTEFLRRFGVNVAEWMEHGILFTVAECFTKYRAPAVYDDLLLVTTEITEVGKARFSLAHEIVRESDGKLLVTGSTVMACVKEGRPFRIPDDILHKLHRATG
ncbi:MAG: YbgC/FadM family acyl-CoA thioesterase [Nitrospirota bacterium]|nr:YbgC/FadM family acyl-CoA thioesterase [Nitrospirota bacterium]